MPRESRSCSASSATRGTSELAHQYSLTDIPAEWSWLVTHRRQYSAFARGDFAKTRGIRWVPDFQPGYYDLAILHLDQQCFETGLWERGKGSLFRQLAPQMDCPTVVICHGTPYYPEQFNEDCTPDGCSNVLREKMKEALGLLKVPYRLVVNSKKAAEQWGMGTCIYHGLDPAEWYDLPKEPRAVTMISPAGLPMYYDREFLRGVKDCLEERGISHCHITEVGGYTPKDWEDYRQFLGRSLVYFNPTRESPMPRARTEAMLSGCCVVTTPHQDASDFIQDGVNGYLCERDPEATADLIKGLIEDYPRAIAIGQAGKETARELFTKERFLADWDRLIHELL